jgi:DNA-binding response OmpR family regulator
VTVLLVEDESTLASIVRRGLLAEGFSVVVAADGDEGFRQATQGMFDAVILDIMLPGLSGYEVLRRMRAQRLWAPVLMLSAKADENAQLDAFELGADDYLTKPFVFRVLVARLRALIRRGACERPITLTAGSLSLNPIRRSVTRGGTAIDLAPKEFAILEYLMRQRNTVVTKTAILENVWEPQYHGDGNLVEVYVSHLRRKIDMPFGTDTIQTIRGFGYRLHTGAEPGNNSGS